MVVATPLKVTLVAPLRLLPVIVTVVPTGPLVGLKELILGGPAVTVKALLLPPVPAAVLTLIGPVVAPLGTVAVIWVFEFTVKLAAMPLKVTVVAPVKWFPPIVTVVPTGPLVGLKELIVGAAVAPVNTKS